MSVGPYCDLSQDVDSKDYKHGAVVSLVMDENERECKSNFLTFLNSFVIFEKTTIWKHNGLLLFFSRSMPDVL